ncbi:hypothetical protein F5Y19DRAFT_475645 [Xylariaceae sp. FL1651]|nr:hypothetical protein F5Y19DRAFT_475645 [Xylariaceae sp. FL1651]
MTPKKKSSIANSACGFACKWFKLKRLKNSKSLDTISPNIMSTAKTPELVLQGERNNEGWKRVLRHCTRPGVARQWTALCFSVCITLVAVLFVILFVAIPADKYFARPSGLSSVGELTNNHDLTPTNNVSVWLDNYSHTVVPRACHSHNDYWRSIPLFTALTTGCTGIEADVWLSDDGKDLLVGHDRHSLRFNKTLRSLYINPLLEILGGRNPNWTADSVYDQAQGVFRIQPHTTVVLMIDVKERPETIWPLLVEQLEPLRQKKFLTRYEEVYVGEFVERQTLWPAPLTVVGSGELDLTALLDTYPNNSYYQYHDTFLDAPLHILPDVNHFWTSNDSSSTLLSQAQYLYIPDNAYYTSVSFKQTIGSVRLGFSASQLETLRTQIYIAKQSGLKSRYWDIPSWPINYRDYIWEVLTREGVGMLNVDDVDGATRGLWTVGYLESVIVFISISVFITIASAACWVRGLYILRRERAAK